MKKRVRVYQRGGFNEFGAQIMPAMRIAQNGANVQQPQYTDEQLVSAVMSIIGEQGGSPEDALQQLVSAGIDQSKANAVVSSAIEYINQQGARQQQAQQAGPTEEEQAQAEEEARAQEAQQEAADRQARYNAQMANDEADLADSDADIDQFASDYIMRNGGALPSKRTFVKNVMKLTKKAAGGQNEQGKADDTDIPGAKGRQAGLQAFVGDLKNKSNNYLQEQDLNAMHTMLSQQMETPYADPNSYMQEPEMQFGGMRPGQQRRMERRANRMVGQIPSAFFNGHQQMFPQGINIMGMPGIMPGMAAMGPQAFQMPARGLYAGGPRLANIQVHKTGLFGRPKQWTATFDNSGYYDPNQYMRDMARMNQANQQTEYQDVEADKKEEETNTSTAENAEVANTEAETQTGEGNGTGNTKPDTGEDVNEEVEQSKKPAGKVPEIDIYGPWKGAMTDLYTQGSKPYMAYVDAKGNVLPDKKGSVGTKQYYYNPKTNKWSTIDGDINDKDRLARLNNWKKTERLHPGHVGMESTSERLMSKPQSGMADDEFITNAVMSGVGIPAALRMAVPGMINIGKPTEQLPPGNNQGVSGSGVPPSVQQALGSGANPRLLGTGEVPNVPAAPTSYGMKPTIADMGSNRIFETESKKVEKTKPVKLSLTQGEPVFQLNSGDDKSWYTYKDGKLYKAPKLSTQTAGQEQWYEIKDPQRVQNIISMSGRNPEAFRQMGGMTDQQSELYRFMGGGEDMSIPTPNERNTADPYFAYGGYFDGGGYVAINDASGNRKYVTENEADAWNSAIKDNEDLSLNNMSWASESPRQNPNYKVYDDLKTKGINVGDFREGIDYSQLEKFPKNTGYRDPYSGWDGTGSMPWITSANAPGSMYGAGMYNPQIGAMYPPLFGGRRRFGPPGGVGYAGSWLKQQGMPFDPRTGQMLGQMPTAAPLSKIDVTKSSLLRKRPKEYTMYFGDQGQPVAAPAQGNIATDAGQVSEDGTPINSRRNRIAEKLMHVPGLRKIGAKMYEQPNLPLPEGTTYTEEQMPSLPLRPIGNIPTGDLVPDQYNNANQPGLSGIDMTGLPDSPIPEITPEEFSFEDQQRFGNVQGPLNQTESTRMGSLPMRPLSNIPTQYDDERVASNFNYTPQGSFKAADIDGLQRFIPQPQGAITEEDYANQLDLLGFPDNAPVMRDIDGNAIQPGQGTPMNIAGPMSDMSNLPDEQGYFNDLQLEQNQEQRIANLPPDSQSNDYYQNVMQPNRDRSQYDFMTDQNLTPEERAQQRQDSLDMFTMRDPELSDGPEPWMTQGMVNTQTARIQAAENARRQQEAILRRRREAESQGVIQNQQRGNGREQRQAQRNQRRNEGPENNTSYTQITPDDNVIQKEAKIANNDLVRQYGAGEWEIEMYDNLLKAPKSNPDQIKAMLRMYPKLKNYKQGTLLKDKQRAEQLVKEANARGNAQQNNPQVRKPSWMRRDGGPILPMAQAGAFSSGSASQYGFNYDPNSANSEENQFNSWWGGLDPNKTNDILAQQEKDLQSMGAYDVDLEAEDASMRQLAEDDDPGTQYDFGKKDPFAVKFKVKDMYNVDFEKGVNQVNAGINFGLGALGEVGDRDRRAQMFNNLNSGIYGSTASRDRGTYETNSGLFRPDEKGFKGVVRQGGNIKRQGGPAYKTGGVTYMSADQVKKFLAEGGELEFV